MDLEKLSLENFDTQWLMENAISIGSKILIGILIIVVGFWLVSKLKKPIKNQLDKTGLSISLSKVISDMISVMLKLLIVLVALNTVGFEITAFVALLGGIAVGVGMALQGSLGNLAGGILVLTFRPYKVGDFIESLDKSGTVEEISLLQTTLLTPDMRTVILPNGSVFNNPIINFSKFGIRRVEIGIGIGYDDDFDKAKEVLTDVFKNEPLMLDERGYVLEIDEFGDSSINLAMYGFTQTENYLKAKWSLNRAAKKALDENGINIPFPQRDLHIISGNIK